MHQTRSSGDEIGAGSLARILESTRWSSARAERGDEDLPLRRGGRRSRVRSVKIESEEGTAYVVLSLTRSFSDEDSILLAPYIAPPMAHYLANKRVNFLDLAGNCRLVVDDFVVSIEGKKPPAVKRDRGIRAPGYAVMFALLADPALLAEPVREIARHAGVSKSAVSDIVSRLRDEGFVTGLRRKALSRHDELLSRLLAWLRFRRSRFPRFVTWQPSGRIWISA